MDNLSVQCHFLSGTLKPPIPTSSYCATFCKHRSKTNNLMEHLLRLYPQGPMKMSGAGELVPRNNELKENHCDNKCDVKFKVKSRSTDNCSTETEPSFISNLLSYNSPNSLNNEMKKIMKSEKLLSEVFTPAIPSFLDSSIIEPACNNGKPVLLGSGCFGAVFLATLHNDIRRLVRN